jgi:hypothetical protein
MALQVNKNTWRRKNSKPGKASCPYPRSFAMMKKRYIMAWSRGAGNALCHGNILQKMSNRGEVR